MADTRNNPHFILFPVNNDRTGYQNVALPVLYVEPRRIDENGIAIQDSNALSVRFYVVDAPDPARVNGPFSQNIRIPDQSLFEVELNSVDLSQKQLNLTGLVFFNSSGQEITINEAVDGDTFQYTVSGISTTRFSNPTTTVVYYRDAYYYDVSDVFINPNDLPKPKRYLFVWESVFFRRIATANNDLKCISGEQGLAQLIFDMNHPGDVHEQMRRMTPGLYFDYDGETVQNDPTLQFYRPFADILQDIFDEQSFLDGVNQIDTIPAEYIPYLAYLIGVDLPNFPGTTDSLRRSILNRGAELQKLKSSRRVLNELFSMFGFVVEIVNLQANLTGNKYLSPGDGLETQLLTQSDIVLSDYGTVGFTPGDVPFVFRPTSDSQVVLNAWIVENGSSKYNQLMALSNEMSNDLESENVVGVSVNVNGVLEPSFVNSIGTSPSNGIIGYSNVVVGEFGFSNGRPVINKNNIIYDRIKNTLGLIFDHNLISVDQNAKVFIFVTYKRLKIIIPSELSNTRTNKFDVEFLSKQDLVIDFNLLQFLLDFVFNLKGFHSLLRKIKVPVELLSVYNVTDTCVDGNDPFKDGTTLGDLQTSPPIIPSDVTCDDGNDRGYKKSDLLLRSLILNGLEEEFQAWKALSPSDCKFTPEGQDKVVSDFESDSGTNSNDYDNDYDHEPDNRPTLCGDNEQKLDYCYKGRVVDNLKNLLVIPLREAYSCNPCGPGLGNVVYWEEYPNRAYLDGQKIGLLNQRITHRFGNVSLHYSDQPYYDGLSNDTLALVPTGIDIEKDNLGFPSHRFLSMNALTNDFNYTDEAVDIGCFEVEEVRRRPWDWYDCDPVYLNARLVFKTNGDQELVYDEEDLIYIGNGLTPDIPSLSDHGDVSDGRIFTNKIYQSAAPSHPSLTFDSSVFTTVETIDTTVLDTGAIFSSVCTTNGEDFIGGYPASSGLVDGVKTVFSDGDTSEDEFLFCSNGSNPTCSVGNLDRPAIAAALCIDDASDTTSTVVQARFFGNTMEFITPENAEYKWYIPYRFDCACLNESCGTNEPTNITGVSCNVDCLYDRNGTLDPGCDKLEIDLVVSLQEAMTLCDRITDFDLADLFCLNDSCDTPGSGTFRYQDDYGIIYEVTWIFMEDTMDITVITKDPRIPGQEQDGFVKYVNGSYQIFRKGIISTVRQIIKVVDTGAYIDSEGSESEVGFFQTNVSCGENEFDQPFAFGPNCALQDNVEALTTNGPHWVSPTEDATTVTAMILALGSDSKTIYTWADPENPKPTDLYWSNPMGTLNINTSS